MKEAFILCGIPGSGKSTFVMQLVQIYPDAIIEVISPDKIRGEINGNEADQSNPELVWKIAHERFFQACNMDFDIVVLDATMTVPKGRKKCVEAYRKAVTGRELSLLVMKSPLEVSMMQNAKRERRVPQEVIEKMYRNLQLNPPSLSEGFDSIMEIEYETPL